MLEPLSYFLRRSADSRSRSPPATRLPFLRVSATVSPSLLRVIIVLGLPLVRPATPDRPTRHSKYLQRRRAATAPAPAIAPRRRPHRVSPARSRLDTRATHQEPPRDWPGRGCSSAHQATIRSHSRPRGGPAPAGSSPRP